MSPSNRVGWVTLLFLAGLAFGLAVAARCKAAPAANFVDRLIAAQPALQSRQEAPVDARELAEAIAAIPRVNPTWAALVLTVAAHESALRARIARGECKPHECDGGRAWGLYQGHKNEANATEWGSPDIRVQTLAAARLLRAVFYMCNGPHSLSPDWAERTLSAYAGKRCDAKWQGLGERMATYQRLRGRL